MKIRNIMYYVYVFMVCCFFYKLIQYDDDGDDDGDVYDYLNI